jgi:hypothetical protein
LTFSETRHIQRATHHASVTPIFGTHLQEGSPPGVGTGGAGAGVGPPHLQRANGHNSGQLAWHLEERWMGAEGVIFSQTCLTQARHSETLTTRRSRPYWGCICRRGHF